MGYINSYLWRLRQILGKQIILMPGAAIVLENQQKQILLQQRSDTHQWGLPGGGAELNQSFEEVAITELQEETGLIVEQGNLLPFASLSKPKDNIFYYPNGDVTHYFSLCFLVQQWQGELKAEEEECLAVNFFDPAAFPDDLSVGTQKVMAHFKNYKHSGKFQLG